MSRYFMDDGSFEVGDAPVVDRTIHVLAIEGGARLFIERGRARGEASAMELATARSRGDARQLHGFTVLGERRGAASGAPLFEVAALFRDDGEVFYQRRAHLVVDGAVVVITLRGALSARAELDAHLDHALGTLRLRGGS